MNFEQHVLGEIVDVGILTSLNFTAFLHLTEMEAPPNVLLEEEYCIHKVVVRTYGDCSSEFPVIAAYFFPYIEPYDSFYS